MSTEQKTVYYFGNLETMEKSVWSSKYRKLKVSGSFLRGRPRKTWSVVIRSKLIERKVNMEIRDRNDRIGKRHGKRQKWF